MITMRAYEVLSQADAVLYDGLVNPEILKFTPANCLLQCVGKRGHGGAWQQSQINDRMVEVARTHNRVVRLKGGDTSIFARTSEELDRLTSEGIQVEVVPGITVALAVAATTGIPITHRDWSSSVALVTGQSQPSDGYSDSEESIDWEALARFPGTLVLYMGLSTAANWSQQLIEAGKPGSTPVALIHRCSWPDQQTVLCDLASLNETLSSHPKLLAPVVTIVGDVVRAANAAGGFTSRPLFGRTFVLTGPSQQSLQLQAMFREQGAQCILAAAIEIVPPADWRSLDQAIGILDHTDWLVFSSKYGVRYFFERLNDLGLDARALRASQVAAVGASTAKVLREYGIRCDLFPEQDAGADVLLEQLGPRSVGKRVTLVRTPEGNTRLSDSLVPKAAEVRQADAYRQAPVEDWSGTIREAIERTDGCTLVVTSSNGARRACELLGAARVQTAWLSISESVTEVLREFGCLQIATCESANYASLVAKAIAMGCPRT